MKKTNGITLIALIITIVVLLVLAGVTIGSVKESKIIGHAQDAASEYTIAQEKERIALAYSEYKIKKTFDTSIEDFEIKGEDVKSEPVGIYGWKIQYENTGNVYGVNTKGEYDEAVTMIIKAVDEISQIFNEVKTTSPELDINGISLEDFMMFEDKYAVIANKNAGETIMPERYVFYNWSKLTDDEIVTVETTYTPTLKSKKVENATNRLCILDTNGDGKVDRVKDLEVYEMNWVFGDVENMISPKTHNILANICFVENSQKTIYQEMLENVLYEEYTGFDVATDFYSEYGNFLLKMDCRDNDPMVSYLINYGVEDSWFLGCVAGNDSNAYFWKLYHGDDGCNPVKYYGTSRKTAN